MEQYLVEIIIGVVIAILGFLIKRELDRHQGDNDELRNMITEREARKYEINKEQDKKLQELEVKMTKIQTTQELCRHCNNKE